MGVKEDIDQKIASKPVYVVSKSFCPFCKIAKQVLQRYNIPAENILIQADMWVMFDAYLADHHQLHTFFSGYCAVYSVHHQAPKSNIAYLSGKGREEARLNVPNWMIRTFLLKLKEWVINNSCCS